MCLCLHMSLIKCSQYGNTGDTQVHTVCHLCVHTVCLDIPLHTHTAAPLPLLIPGYSDRPHSEAPAQHAHIIKVDMQFLYSPNSLPSSFCIPAFNTLDKQLSCRGQSSLLPRGGGCVHVRRRREREREGKSHLCLPALLNPFLYLNYQLEFD